MTDTPIEEATAGYFVAEIRKWGDSKGIIIPAKIRDSIGLTNGDFVEVKIGKVKLTLDNAKCYVCMACQHTFETSDEHPYCPACDAENLREIQE